MFLLSAITIACFGLHAIWVNMTVRNVEFKSGPIGYVDILKTLLIWSPENAVTKMHLLEILFI